MKPTCILAIAFAMIVTAFSVSPAPADEAGPTTGLKRVAAVDPASSAKSDLTIPLDMITAVIYPIRSATVGTEVRGIVDALNFKEGDLLEEGCVVAEVSKQRYTAVYGEFKGNYKAICEALDQSKEELTTQEALYNNRAATFDDLTKSKFQVRILEARKEEASHKLKQAEQNMNACVIRAPFTGFLAVRYHEPYEAIENLEKIFEVVDTTKVYARANWPESRLSELEIGKKAIFTYQGREYPGEIAKISTLIDPASKSKRVHVTIDNKDQKLNVGMSGNLAVVQ
jgi:RND family efflux transporter MFP subunit